MTIEVGTRIGAYRGLLPDTNIMESFGYGVYNGEKPVKFTETLEINNPHMTMDSGREVWGMECWWGPEERMKEQFDKFIEAGYTLKEIGKDDE